MSLGLDFQEISTPFSLRGVSEHMITPYQSTPQPLSMTSMTYRLTPCPLMTSELPAAKSNRHPYDYNFNNCKPPPLTYANHFNLIKQRSSSLKPLLLTTFQNSCNKNLTGNSSQHFSRFHIKFKANGKSLLLTRTWA